MVHGKYTFKVWKEAKIDMKSKRRKQEEGGWKILTLSVIGGAIMAPPKADLVFSKILYFK